MSAEKINIYKKMIEEANKLIEWQQEVYTKLHNINADWITSGTISWDRMPFQTWAELLAKLTNDVGDYLNLAGLQIGGVEVITSGRVLKNITHMVIPTSAPETPEAGSMYFDTVTGTLYIYDGTTWKSITLT